MKSDVRSVRQPMPGVVYPPEAALRRYADVLPDETLPAAFLASFERHADRTALLGAEGNLSYRELDRITDRAAAGLLRLGLKPLDRAVFQMGNSRSLIVALIGCWKAGIIPLCTLASHREAEIGYLGRHSAARVHFIDNDPKFDFAAFATRMRGEVPTLEHTIDPAALARLLAGEDPAEAKRRAREVVGSLDPRQVAVFQLSGGTTGVPKIIPRFHNEYLYNMRACHAWLQRCADETVFCVGPMIHNAGMVCHWGPALLAGGAVITDHDLSVEGLRTIFGNYRPNYMFMPRPLLGRMKEALADLDWDPAKVHGVVTASNSKTVREEFGMRGLHIFGMSEGLVMTTRPGDPVDALDTTVGRPISAHDEVRILHPGTGVPVTLGTIGELVCRGPYTLHGYYDAADRNREAFTSDGFYRSGDLISERTVGGNSYFVFEGRLKDVINRAGEKINCDEVERAVRGYPGLIDVALVAMPDEVYIERACAFVCMQRGAPVPGVAELGEHLRRAGLAKYKWPERVEPIETLPTTNSGKISKPKLRELIKALLAKEAT